LCLSWCVTPLRQMNWIFAFHSDAAARDSGADLWYRVTIFACMSPNGSRAASSIGRALVPGEVALTNLASKLRIFQARYYTRVRSILHLSIGPLFPIGALSFRSADILVRCSAVISVPGRVLTLAR